MNKDTWLKMQQGDHEAFSELYSEYVDLLFGYGMKIVPDKDLVGEYIQNLYVYIWTHRDTINYPRNTVPYLIVSLRNMMLKGLKQNKSANIVPMDVGDIEYGFELFINVEDTLENTDLDADRIIMLENELKKLTASEREIVYLKYYKNLSAEDVASIKGVSTQYIFNVLSRSIKKLRKQMSFTKVLVIAFIYILMDSI